MATERERHPELFAEEDLIDPRTQSRTVPLEILSLGMSRTGTASLQAALQIIGYDPTYHGFTMMRNLLDVDMWLEGLNAKYFPETSKSAPFGRQEFDQLLGRYRACTDFPANAFGPELIAAYPEAKVILVERDLEPWYRSFEATVIKTVFNPLNDFVAGLDYKLKPINDLGKPWVQGFWRSRTEDEFKANARLVYREHYQMIRKLTPSENLLDLNLEEGWVPLCRFLGRPIPHCPFPRVNEGDWAKEKVKIMVKGAAIRLATKFALFLCSVSAVVVAIYLYRG